SVGSHVPQVILFGAIPAIIPVIPVIPAEVPIVFADLLVAPEVGVVFVTSPAEGLDLVDYSSSSDSDSSKDSIPLAPELQMVSPFLCSDDSKANIESEPAEQRPERHEYLAVMMLWFRGGGTWSHLGHPYRRDHHLTTLLHHHLSFPLLPLLPYPRFVEGKCVSHRSSDHYSSPDFTSNSSYSGSSSDSSLDTFLGSPSDSLSEISSVYSSGCDASEAVADLGISDGVGVDTQDGIGMGVKIAISDIKEDEEKFDTAHRQLKATQLMSSEERASLTNRIRRRSFVRFVWIVMILRGNLRDWSRLLRGVWDFALSLDMTITRSGMTPKAIEELTRKALANYKATHAANALETENQSQNGSDGDNGNGGNGDKGNNGIGYPNENGRGIEGVVCLTRWLEKMETVFHISNCPEVYQVKYATCTLLDSALTWWNSHKRIIGVDDAFAMT
nr:reverse transcriptase domain-containing protein [Tanacetum cinerariifolium]